ncbi:MULTISPECIES: mechanosensitive ion channel domain-containing protein [unclassified Corynebacterium]|uniref:mechanosensitive ion channel family protein n=1 Tax=unclassified Corynebacterium TaxID=2624378 RepID=UPI002A9F6BA1|nr:mechanosensitive ion channel [Mycobacteriaceae bacterium]MDY5830037.1 mechanosensitive ion channel [Corynebacterium sp.]
MNLKYYLFQLWGILVDHGLPLLGIVLTAVLIPRIGRLVVRIIESRLDQEEEATKARLALVGALVYVGEVVAYFLLVVAALSNIGVPPLGAAIPATVVSAAVGFGAQSIIGDFLSGFFILSEKQFGVGDYVSFDGATGIEGTVVALTLRTTKVRTPTGEVVTVPNGSAGVVTNYSQDWSRAVVNLAVPVSTGENPADITAQVERISREAIADPQIAPDVVDEVEVLPATGLEAPTAAGQPWQVNYRVMVRVNPARQWAVERGIRSALLNAFWDHYHLAGDAPGELPGPAVETTRREEAGDAPAQEAADAETVVLAGPDGATPMEDPADVAADQAALQGDDEEAPAGTGSIWRDDQPTTRWGKLVTLGGRIRASTTGLFAALAVIGILALASSNPENASAGWLSPANWMPTTTESAPETTPAEDADAGTGTAEATEPTAENAEPQPDAATETTAPQAEPEGQAGAAGSAGSGDSAGSAGQAGQGGQAPATQTAEPTATQTETVEPTAATETGDTGRGDT